MKNLISIAMVALLLMGIISCDKVEKLAQKDLNVEFVKTTPSLILATEGMLSFSTDISVDTPETHEYLDKIKSVKIKKFTYQIVDFRDGEDYCEVISRFYSDGLNLGGEKINLKNANDNKTVFEITNVDGLNKLANSLKSGNKVAVGLECIPERYDTAAKFKVKITIESTVTVGL